MGNMKIYGDNMLVDVGFHVGFHVSDWDKNGIRMGPKWGIP